MKDTHHHFIPLAGSTQSWEMDSLAQQEYGVSAETLMESAGALSAHTILAQQKKPSHVMVLCGPGNNGGDGLVTACHLLSSGLDVEVFLPAFKIHNPNPLKEPSLYERQKQRFLKLKGVFKSLEDRAELKKVSKKSDMIVDALFGVGLSRDIAEPYEALIRWINSQNKCVVSLDTPSGLNVDTGCLRGSAVRAQLTLSFGLAKPGFYLQYGPSHVGQLQVFPIGLPPALLSQGKSHFLIKKSWVSKNLPQRGPMDHKAQHGHLLVLAGSEGFWGAGWLSAEAGYRMGAGYVTLCSADKGTNGTGKVGSAQKTSSTPRTLPAPCPVVLTQNIEDPQLLQNKTAVVIGPGLGVTKTTKKLLLNLKKTDHPVVVDADAWTVCVKEELFPLPSHWVVTPHSGELSRLLSITGREVDQDRCFYAKKASRKTGCFVLLKGFYSVLAHKDKCWIIPTGNKALAKAGTGDVLSGFIGTLMARGLSSFSATAVGAFVHGLLAEEWVSSGKDPETLMAQDLKELLPVLLQKLRV